MAPVQVWANATIEAGPAAHLNVSPKSQPQYEVHAPNLTLELSSDGEIIGMALGPQSTVQAVQGDTHLGGCHTEGPVTVKRLAGDGLEFTRAVSKDAQRRCTVVERFTPTTNSVRWEVQIHSDGEDWSAPVDTMLKWPTTKNILTWAAWQDPIKFPVAKCGRNGSWHDPLIPRPFANNVWTYGESFDGKWDSRDFLRGNIVTLPLFSILDPEHNRGLTLVQSPEDVLLNLDFETTANGQVTLRRKYYRFGGGNTARFSMDLAPAADWRAAMKWITERYPAFFEPPNPEVQKMAGTAAYTGDERPVGVQRLKRMALRVVWKLSDDYAYMGMFLPPLTNSDARWERTSDTSDKNNPPGYKPQWTSFRRLNDFGCYLQTNGFYLLSYFNVTEFGRDINDKIHVSPKLAASPDLWTNASAFLKCRMAGAEMSRQAWQHGRLMDPGDPDYQNFLLEQAERHLRMIPASAGLCIDRADNLRFYNTNADDGTSWFGGHRARALVVSWRSLMNRLGPLMHRHHKVIFCNLMDPRLDLARQVDGVYDEFGDYPAVLNGVALLCVDKPFLAWTRNSDVLSDKFFQRLLYLGAFPTAPYPLNNHCIQPSPQVDRWYYDYGPLFDLLRGKHWVLEPHCIEVIDSAAKANLFQVSGGWVAPVVFGSTNSVAVVKIQNVQGMNKDLRCEVVQPGVSKPVIVAFTRKAGILQVRVPLCRGCAMPRVLTN
ncbi:MAG: hypothetical protein ACREFE_03665 [Limisphaerales bacterium]